MEAKMSGMFVPTGGSALEFASPGGSARVVRPKTAILARNPKESAVSHAFF
ncbi:hypothetical protein AB3N59_07130 [Leptospira sp. WS92.C1]